MCALAIEIESFTKRYHQFTAVDNLSLSVKQGEFFGLLGHNGAGKTTLINALAGLIRPTSGRLKVMGYDVQRQYRMARLHLGVVPQELIFDPFFPVRELLRIQSGLYGIRHNDDWIDEILFHLNLTDKANSPMRALSGGMKRRVLVAQALVHRPEVIILDEPTAGVDVELRHGLWVFIQQLNQQGHTIVLTTHYLEEAQELCSRIAMVKLGKLVMLEETQALLAKFASKCVVLELAHTDNLVGLRLDDRVHIQGQQLTYRYDSIDQITQLLNDLQQLGVKVNNFQTKEADLEHVFVEVMGRE